MLTSLILVSCLLQEQVLTKGVFLPMPDKSPTKLLLKEFVDPLAQPKLSPKKFGEEQQPWQFPWCIEGDAADGQRFQPYFLVYGQEHKLQGDKLEPVSRMLLRLWDFNLNKVGLNHNPHYMGGIIEVFLCFGGTPGGEQIIGLDKGTNPRTGKIDDVQANTIYIYDLDSFKSPVEMAREVAHEYGHATIPAVGGYKDPEDWANGYLGEKLYLRWLRDSMAKGEAGTLDSMGATKQDLDAWISTNIDPLIEKSAQVLPTDAVMSDTSKAGMDEYIGLSLYIDTLYSDTVLARSMKISASYDAKDYPPAAVLAAEEPDQIKLNIPSYLYGKTIWIPLGTGKLSGTNILKKDKSGWVQIKAGPGPVFVYNNR